MVLSPFIQLCNQLVDQSNGNVQSYIIDTKIEDYLQIIDSLLRIVEGKAKPWYTIPQLDFESLD